MTVQTEIVSIDMLISKTHPYREFKKLINFDKIVDCVEFEENESPAGADGYGKARLTMCLILQFLEDLSDRQLMRFLSENIAGKWFTGFGLAEETPTYSTFCKFRKLVGRKNMGRLFEAVNDQLRQKGVIRDVFTFVDSTALISKLTTWEERDKAIKDGETKFNNETAKKKKYQIDKQARFGSKGKKKFWYGYKKTVAVDTQSGMITKVAITPANVTDAQSGKHVLPKQGAVIADKGYIALITWLSKYGLHPMIILKNNMLAKIAELDKWYTKLRAPYERTFSKQNKRVRYIGTAKNQGAEFMYAIAYNLRRMVVLEKTAF
jgi:IS5 family transposase